MTKQFLLMNVEMRMEMRMGAEDEHERHYEYEDGDVADDYYTCGDESGAEDETHT